jgi:hypothetical protein
MVTVTGPAHEPPVEVTPLMWPWPRASGWRGAGAGDPGGEGVPGDRVALVGPGAARPAGDVAGVLGVRLAGVPAGGEVRLGPAPRWRPRWSGPPAAGGNRCDDQAAAVAVPPGRECRDIGIHLDLQRPASIRRAPSRTTSSTSDANDPCRPRGLSRRQGLSVSTGLYLSGRRANAGHCLRTFITWSSGRNTHPADPQVSSIARHPARRTRKRLPPSEG